MHSESGIDVVGGFLCINYVHNGGMVYGYARVASDGQSMDAQVRRLKAAGCAKVYRETASRASSDRAQLRKAIAALAAGDVLLVTRLDRLARSTRDLLNTLATVTEAGAGFRSLDSAWADTTTPHGSLLVTILGGLAEFERSLIAARTGEGRVRAAAKGIKMGPKFKLSPYQRAEAAKRRQAGENVVDIARSYNVSHSTICRLQP